MLLFCKHDLSQGFKVDKLCLFSSCVRGEQIISNDLDILVEFSEPMSLIEFVRLENRLSYIHGVKVDSIMKTTLKPRIGKHILEEVVQV